MNTFNFLNVIITILRKHVLEMLQKYVYLNANAYVSHVGQCKHVTIVQCCTYLPRFLARLSPLCQMNTTKVTLKGVKGTTVSYSDWYPSLPLPAHAMHCNSRHRVMLYNRHQSSYANVVWKTASHVYTVCCYYFTLVLAHAM